MKSVTSNEIKIYNLSAGKSLPEWLPVKKKKKLMSKDVDLRRRIELIQDFDMPGLSSNVQLSPDGNYILATGVYKPRVRCYDLKNLSMKFERCFDAEVVRFLILSQDYSKLVFLQCDRYVEFHAQYGRYFRLRIPKFGRDLAYHTPSCDLYVVGTTHEAYRLNLELGRFMTPIETNASTVNRVVVNPIHHLLLFGTEEGCIEAWDPRSYKRVGILDAALASFTQDTDITGIPSISALTFRDGMTLGVGTATGQILLYDIRSSKPLLVKDHYYSLPIKDIEFHKPEQLVMSMDSKVVKIWNQHTGTPYTTVEAEPDFNDLCLVPNTGMFFIANEEKKLLSFYIPSIGPAPRWCSFLDNLTEELEETNIETLYDDYKFITSSELNDIGLGHLIGTSLLRSYTHGYFMDMRLYRKAKDAAQPFQYDEFKKNKIREKLQQERTNRVKFDTLPKVNRELALKLRTMPTGEQKKKNVQNLLEDDRFKTIFSNPDFEVDKTVPEYKLLNPTISRLDKKNSRKLDTLFKDVDTNNDEEEGKGSSTDESSSDDDVEWRQAERQESRRLIKEKEATIQIKPKFYEIRRDEQFQHSDLTKEKSQTLKMSLGDRVKAEGNTNIKTKGPLGGREMSFQLKSNQKKEDDREKAKHHHEERRKIRRSAQGLKSKRNSWKQ